MAFLGDIICGTCYKQFHGVKSNGHAQCKDCYEKESKKKKDKNDFLNSLKEKSLEERLSIIEEKLYDEERKPPYMRPEDLVCG